MIQARPTVLEFFAGIGLARMGLESAGFRINFANDVDPKKREMHAGHWGTDPNYVLSDVFALASNEVPDADVAWASFPCIDLSLAGNRAGLEGRSSSVYWGFFNVLSQKSRRPRLVIIENVHGMLTSRDGQDLSAILLGLNDLGYRVDVLAVDAAHFVPQSRPRLFIVGFSPDVTVPAVPIGRSAIRPEALLRFRARHADLQWSTLPTAALPARTETFGDIAERFPEGSDIWWDQAATSKLVSQMSPRHLAAVQSLSESSRITFGTVYRRVRATGCMAEVRLDGLAGCLRTPRGGSSRQFVVQMGGGQIAARHMTAIEYARLQGAGQFKIRVPFNQALFGFGDAVCVPAVAWLAEQCKRVAFPVESEEAVA